MNQIEIFNSPEFGSIRIVEENGKYLFCGADVAKSLGYKDTVNALKTHCREDGVAFYHLILGRKKAGDLFQISCSVCRCEGGGYLAVKVRDKLTRCVGGKLEFYDFLFFKKSIVLFTINTIHIKPTIPQTIESFKSANPPVYCIA